MARGGTYHFPKKGAQDKGVSDPPPIRAAAQWAVSHEIELYGGVCRGTVSCRHCFVLGDIARVPYKVKKKKKIAKEKFRKFCSVKTEVKQSVNCFS